MSVLVMKFFLQRFFFVYYNRLVFIWREIYCFDSRSQEDLVLHLSNKFFVNYCPVNLFFCATDLTLVQTGIWFSPVEKLCHRTSTAQLIECDVIVSAFKTDFIALLQCLFQKCFILYNNFISIIKTQTGPLKNQKR